MLTSAFLAAYLMLFRESNYIRRRGTKIVFAMLMLHHSEETKALADTADSERIEK